MHPMLDVRTDTHTFTVRSAIARQLRVPVGSVLPDSALMRDLGIDTIDLAFIAVYLEDLTGVDNIAIPLLDSDATVADLALVLTPWLDANPGRSRRTAHVAGGARALR